MEAPPVVLIVVLTALVSLAAGFIVSRQLTKTQGSKADNDTKAFFDHLMHNQHQLQGHVKSLTDMLNTRQYESTKHLGERLDSLSQRLGHNMTESTQATMQSLAHLNERMAIIDQAQNRLGQLSERMVDLQGILSNKQSRGAFGQARMEAIIRDALPKDAYAFQPTLSNKTRPDCLISLPEAQEKLVIDAKFPLEAFTLFREADNQDSQQSIAVQVRETIGKHVRDIANRYLIPGETQDMALMFVPSESIYADLYESFYEIMQKAFRQRVMIVSPSLLMLAVQLMQTMVRDARMREQTDLIKKEVIILLKDVGRLDERVHKLQDHFRRTDKDIEDILISTKKIQLHAGKIETVDIKPLETDKTNHLDKAHDPKTG